MAEDSIKIKTPSATLVFGFDWSTWLNDGETITNHTLSTTASGLILTNDYHTSGSVIFFASGGVTGQRYRVVCRITTSGSPSQTDERTLKIDVKNR